MGRRASGVGSPARAAGAATAVAAVSSRPTSVVRLADGKVLGSRSTGGAAPCHLSVHPSGRWLLSANYGTGSVAVHPIDASKLAAGKTPPAHEDNEKTVEELRTRVAKTIAFVKEVAAALIRWPC